QGVHRTGSCISLSESSGRTTVYVQNERILSALLVIHRVGYKSFNLSSIFGLPCQYFRLTQRQLWKVFIGIGKLARFELRRSRDEHFRRYFSALMNECDHLSVGAHGCAAIVARTSSDHARLTRKRQRIQPRSCAVNFCKEDFLAIRGPAKDARLFIWCIS